MPSTPKKMKQATNQASANPAVLNSVGSKRKEPESADNDKIRLENNVERSEKYVLVGKNVPEESEKKESESESIAKKARGSGSKKDNEINHQELLYASFYHGEGAYEDQPESIKQLYRDYAEEQLEQFAHEIGPYLQPNHQSEVEKWERYFDNLM